MRRFDTRTTVVTLGASAGAIAVARVFLGDAPDFHVEPLPYPGFGTVPIHLALGIVAGCAGLPITVRSSVRLRLRTGSIDGRWNCVPPWWVRR